jgi:hypothetical protein
MTTRIYTIFKEDCCWTEGNKLQLNFDTAGLIRLRFEQMGFVWNRRGR